MSVRLAGPADEDALYDLLLALERDNSLGVPHHEGVVRAHIRLGTERTGGMHGVIDGPDGTLIGSVGIIIARYWWSMEECYLSQLWLFVRPEHRRGARHAEALRAWARERHADFERALGKPVPFDFSLLSLRRFEAKARWFRRGAKQVGAIFVLDRDII